MGHIRAYDIDQSHHALHAWLISRGFAGNESELFGIMTTPRNIMKIIIKVFTVIMLIPFSIFIVNAIRVGFSYALQLSAEPLYLLANGSISFFYLLEAVAIVVTTLFLLWIWEHYWNETKWLILIFFVGVIGLVVMGVLISHSTNLTGLQYQGCGAYLSTDFNVAVEKQNTSFCSSPHDYARVNTYLGFKGGDFCILPGGNVVRIVRSHSNEFDPIFSAHCFDAVAVQTKQPKLCLETKSSYTYDGADQGTVDCVENYEIRNGDIAACELLTRDKRNHCIFSVALAGTRSVKTCEAIDTDSTWRNYCFERMSDKNLKYTPGQ